MKKRLWNLGLVCLLALSALRVHGQDAPAAPPLQLDLPKPQSPDRYGLSFRMGFNISADFKTSFGSSAPGPATGGGINRTYDDGYNKVDVTGNAGGYTAYWRYQNDAQYDPNANTLSMHSASGSASSTGRDGDPQLGFEVTYNRALGGNQTWRWGFEAAFNYMNLTIHDDHPLSAAGSLTTDAFAVPTFQGGGSLPPPPGQDDYFAQPGDYLISDSPTRTVAPLAAAVTGSRRFDADVFGWRIGPYAELRLADKLSAVLGAGLSLALVTSDLSLDETFTYSINGAAVSVPVHASSSNDDLLVGGYVRGGLNLSLTKNWGAFVGAEFQDLGHYNHSLGDNQARLDFTQAVFVSLGATFSF